jgi:hypothetical protein
MVGARCRNRVVNNFTIIEHDGEGMKCLQRIGLLFWHAVSVDPSQTTCTRVGKMPGKRYSICYSNCSCVLLYFKLDRLKWEVRNIIETEHILGEKEARKLEF